MNCDPDTLWVYTHDFQVYEQWALRFYRIRHLPKSGTDNLQRFLYSTSIGFGINVSGVGMSVKVKIKGKKGEHLHAEVLL